jgi:hypothetical protein
MTMTLVETTILSATIRMRYADNADPAKATEWIDIQTALPGLMNRHGHPLGKEPDLYFLAEVRLAALRFAQEAIDAETRRLANLADR